MGYKFGKVANFGISNTLTPSSNSNYSIAMGTDNAATSLRDSVVIGSGNTMNTGSLNYILGDNNNLSGMGSGVTSQNVYGVGFANTISDAGTCLGILNTLSGYGGLAVGFGASSTGQYSNSVGYATTASGDFALALGSAGTASGRESVSVGNSTASGRWSVAIGQACDAVTSGSIAIGRNAQSTTNRNGSIALCTISSDTLNFRKGFGQVQTTDATQTTLYLNNAGSSNGAITCVEQQVLAFDIVVVGKKSDDSQGCMFRLEGVCRRASGGNITLIGSVTQTVLARDDASWDATAAVDTGTQSLQVKVTGVAATTIDWFATINFYEIGN